MRWRPWRTNYMSEYEPHHPHVHVWSCLETAEDMLKAAQSMLPAEGVPEAFRIRLRVMLSRMTDIIDTYQLQDQLAQSHSAKLPCWACPYHGAAVSSKGKVWICNGGPGVCAALAKIGWKPLEDDYANP